MGKTRTERLLAGYKNLLQALILAKVLGSQTFALGLSFFVIFKTVKVKKVILLEILEKCVFFLLLGS